MNKKEVSELKRLFTLDRCPITRICGCYVDAEKNKVAEVKHHFQMLEEEEMFKYFEIFKKTLSGTLGKNLIDMEFPLDQEEEGGAQEFLYRLKKSALDDEELLQAFYDKVIETFSYPENYYIILIHCTYDIPRRAKDGAEMFDASEDVYEYLLCSICPVKLTKPGLCYNEEEHTIMQRIRDWFVEPPVTGFLFPAFNDRNTDLHAMLYYSKNPDELKADFAEQLLGCRVPLSASFQKETFNTVVADTLHTECTFDAVKNIHEALNGLLEERKDDPQPPVLDKDDMRQLLSQSGASSETLEHFDESFNETAGDERAELFVSNIASTRKFEIKTPNIVINVKPECADLVEMRIIDGRPYFVIPADDAVELNGIPIRTLAAEENPETE
jgi:hypothetical protein